MYYEAINVDEGMQFSGA